MLLLNEFNYIDLVILETEYGEDELEISEPSAEEKQEELEEYCAIPANRLDPICLAMP